MSDFMFVAEINRIGHPVIGGGYIWGRIYLNPQV